MLIIGICGASGSGKTTLAEELARAMKGRAVLINQDAYYRDHPDLTFAQREQLNYDEPDIFEHDQFFEDMTALKEGRPIRKKAYDFTQHRRADTNEWIQPGDVLIVEGIHVFYDPRVRELMDFKVFIRVDPDICLLRRAQRDIQERARTIEGVASQYLSTVKPMYDRWIRNYIDYADLIVAGGGKNQRIIDILGFYINFGLEDKKMNGYTKWYVPDCYWADGGTDGPYVSHESICVLNESKEDAKISITLYFEDRDPIDGYEAVCAAQRTHHVRMDRLLNAQGQAVPRGVPYAAVVECSIPVYVQYSRCDTTQPQMAFMTAIPMHA